MDPNAALAEIRRIQAEWPDIEDDSDQAEALAELANRVSDLDQWLSNGGSLPEAWSRTAWQRLDDRARQHEAERDANPASVRGSVENQLAGAYRNAIKLAGLTAPKGGE